MSYWYAAPATPTISTHSASPSGSCSRARTSSTRSNAASVIVIGIPEG